MRTGTTSLQGETETETSNIAATGSGGGGGALSHQIELSNAQQLWLHIRHFLLFTRCHRVM